MLIKLTVQIVLKMANYNVEFILVKKKTGGTSVQVAGIDSKLPLELGLKGPSHL